MSERWRPVPSVSGLLASSHGRLMVAPHHELMPNGGSRTYGGVATRGQWDGYRYIYTRRGRSYKVARLVCEAFHGSAPADAVCMHLDECSGNNTAVNLQWGTQRENLNAAGFLAYCRARTGDRSPYRKGRRVAA